MKAAVVKGNSTIEIKNIEKQSLGSGDILVQMRACGICGSDVEKVFGKYGQPSMRLGHEPAGIIHRWVQKFQTSVLVIVCLHIITLHVIQLIAMNVAMEMKQCVKDIMNQILNHVDLQMNTLSQNGM